MSRQRVSDELRSMPTWFRSRRRLAWLSEHLAALPGSGIVYCLTVAAAEVAVGLAIIVSLYRARQTIHTDELVSLKG